MINKKGFTLIELLAVILILGIILAIATQVVFKSVNTTKKESLKISSQNVIKVVENAISTGSQTDGEIVFDGTIKPLNYNGEINGSGKIIVNNGQTSLYICNAENCATKSFDEPLVSIKEASKVVFIEKIEDLIELSNSVRFMNDTTGYTYVLKNDLDFLDVDSYNNYQDVKYGDLNGNGTIEGILIELTTGKGFPSIGFLNMTSGESMPFRGLFDGQKYSISNLFLSNRNDDLVGMFGFSNGATIKNLNLSGVANTGTSYTALLASYLYNSSISNVNVSGNVNVAVTEYAEGFALVAAYSVSSKIENATAKGKVLNTNTNTIGVTGLIAGVMVNNPALATANNDAYSVLNNCYAEGEVMGDAWNGLIVGGIDGGHIYNSHAKGIVRNATLTIGNIGGFVGKLNAGTIKNSYTVADVIINNAASGVHIGGFVGMMGSTDADHSGLKIENCYNIGNVTAITETGNFIGQNGASSENSRTKYLTIEKVYSIGNLSNTRTNPFGLGGVVGRNIMNMKSVFFAGNVYGSTTNTTAGIVIGVRENAAATFNQSFYKENSIITGTNNLFGQSVNLLNLSNSLWYTDTLGFDNNFKYNDGYYPLLYYFDVETGKPTNILLPDQVLRKVE